MNNRLPTMTLALLIIISASAGCGSVGPTVVSPPLPPPPIDEDLADLAPADFDRALWIMLPDLRQSPLWSAAEVFSEEEHLAEIRNNTGIDPLTQVNEILVVGGTIGENQDEEFVALVKGDFSAEAAIQQAENTKTATPLEIHGFKGVEKMGIVMLSLTERTLAIGTREIVTRSAELGRGTGRSLRRSEEFEAFSIPPGSVVALRLRDKSLYSRHSKIAGQSVSGWAWKESIAKLDASMTIREGLHIKLRVDVATIKNAQAAKKDLDRFKRRISGNPLVMLIGVDWFFEKISLVVDETVVEINVVLDPADLEEVRRLAERLKKIRELANTPEENDEAPRSFPAPPGLKIKSKRQPETKEAQ